MLLLLTSIVAFAEPNRCVASVQLPAEGCQVRGDYTVTGAGPSEAAARKAALAALQDAVARGATALRVSQPSVVERDLERCDARAAQAFVECFPEPRLKEDRFCFVSLEDKDCWTGEVLTMEAKGWKVYAEATAQMCKAVDEHLVKQAYSDVAVARVRCAAACAAHTVVRCPDT